MAVAETVIVPEEEVVELWHSFFSGKTQVVTKNVAKQITHQQSVAHQQRQFSVWVLAFELPVAWVAYRLLLWTCALLWRRPPRRFLPDN